MEWIKWIAVTILSGGLGGFIYALWRIHYKDIDQEKGYHMIAFEEDGKSKIAFISNNYLDQFLARGSVLVIHTGTRKYVEGKFKEMQEQKYPSGQNLVDDSKKLQ